MHGLAVMLSISRLNTSKNIDEMRYLSIDFKVESAVPPLSLENCNLESGLYSITAVSNQGS